MPPPSLRSSVPRTTPQPPVMAPLPHFEFNCFPPSTSFKTPSVKIRAKQLFDDISDAPLALRNFRLDPVKLRLKTRKMLSDANNQCLMYETSDGPFGLLDDDGHHNAVEHAREDGFNFLNVKVRTQEDIG